MAEMGRRGGRDGRRGAVAAAEGERGEREREMRERERERESAPGAGEGIRRLCRVPDRRHSAKSIFFAECRDLALGEVLKKISSSLPSASWAALGKIILFLVFCHQFFFEALVH